MKRLLKEIIAGATYGICIGFIISLIISVLYNTGEYYPSSFMFVQRFDNILQAVLVSTVLWVFMGIVTSVPGEYIFDRTDWSITRMTITHFCVMYFLFFPLSILAGWYPVNILNMTIFTVIFVIIYITIWYVTMKSTQNDIRAINQKMQHNTKIEDN